MVGEPVQQRAGEALRTKHFSPLVEGQVGGYQDGAPLVALAEDLEEQFRPGGGQGDEAQLIDGQQVEQPSFVPGPSGPLYLVFTPTRRPGAVTQAVYFANMALLDRRACRMVAESGGPGWKQPCLRPRLGIPPCRSSGGGWKPGLFLPGRTVYFCPFQPGVQQDDALRLRQGLGERAGGQESGPAGGATGPRRLLPGKYPSRRSQRGQERPRRPPGTAGLVVEADTLVVTHIDRLSRGLTHGLQVIEGLHRAGVEFRSLSEDFDTATATGKLQLTMVSPRAVPAEATMPVISAGIMKSRVNCSVSLAKVGPVCLEHPRKKDIMKFEMF